MVVGITLVKDEADILGETLDRMGAEVHALVVCDNGSTDGTRELLEERRCSATGCPITVLDDPEVGYYQSRKMSGLARFAARELEADWVVPFDADERWYGAGGERVADVLHQLPADVRMATAVLYDHVPTGHDPDGRSMQRMGWRRREPAPLAKVAVRPVLPVTIEQGNHGAHWAWNSAEQVLVVRHFPYRSPEQFISKVRNGSAAYAATDLPGDQGAHWRQYGQILAERGPEVLVDEVFRRWFWVADPEHDEALIFDPAP